MVAIDQALRCSGGGADPEADARLSAQSRDRLAARLRQALRAALGGIRCDLLRRGDLAEERGQRHFLYGIRDALLEKGVSLESLLAGHWRREYDAAVSGRNAVRVSVLSLHDRSAADPAGREEVQALQAIAAALRGQCAAALAVVDRHLAALTGQERVDGAAAELLCRALRGAFSEADFSGPARLELLRCVLPYVGSEFAPVYVEWGAQLASLDRLSEFGFCPVPVAAGRDRAAPRRETSRLAAEAALAGFLALPLPGAVATLLAGEWRELLVRAHAEADGDAWNSACATAGELVWSVRIGPGSPERKHLIGRLPNLLKRLNDGFERLGVDGGRRLELLDALFAVHAAILRGEAPPPGQRAAKEA